MPHLLPACAAVARGGAGTLASPNGAASGDCTPALAPIDAAGRVCMLEVQKGMLSYASGSADGRSGGSGAWPTGGYHGPLQASSDGSSSDQQHVPDGGELTWEQLDELLSVRRGLCAAVAAASMSDCGGPSSMLEGAPPLTLLQESTHGARGSDVGRAAKTDGWSSGFASV